MHLLGRQTGEMEHQGLLIRIIIYHIHIFQSDSRKVGGGIGLFWSVYKQDYVYFMDSGLDWQ